MHTPIRIARETGQPTAAPTERQARACHPSARRAVTQHTGPGVSSIGSVQILLRNLRLLAVTLPGALLCACRGSERPLRLGASLTVQQSGALAVLESLWTGAPLAVALGPSGQILRAAADGNLDVVITQAPRSEERRVGKECRL